MNQNYYEKVLSSHPILRTDKEFNQNKNETVVLALGHSHVQHGFDSTVIANSHALGITGENYIQTYYQLNSFLVNKKKDLAKLKIVVINIDSVNFMFISKFGFEWYWKKYINLPLLSIKHKNLNHFKSWIKSYFPFRGDGLSIIIDNDALTYRKNLKMVNGHLITSGDYSKINNTKELAKIRVDKKFSYTNDYFNEIQFLYLQKIINLSKENNLSVILVRFPITVEFYEEIEKKIKDMDMHYKPVYDFAQKHNFVYLADYHDLFFDNHSMFSDADHLNGRGSEIFTKKLYDDFIKDIISTKNTSIKFSKFINYDFPWMKE